GVSRTDDLVARADPQGHEGGEHGVAAGGDADGVADADRVCALALKRLELGPEDVAPRSEDALKRRGELALDCRVPAGAIEEGDTPCAHGAPRRSRFTSRYLTTPTACSSGKEASSPRSRQWRVSPTRL